MPATARFYEAVSNKALTHDGDAELAKHISHRVIKTDAWGTRITKDTKKSSRRIDLAMAALMAQDRASDLAAHTMTFY